MNLPLRYQSEPGTEAVLTVDGAFGAPGLNLSHWPGNQTPTELKRDLSTGIALAFSALPEDERGALTEGLTAVVNNHYDTDGCLSLFAIQHPEVALAHANKLVEWARAGDFFQASSEEAFCADVLITAFADAERSPVRDRFAGCGELERYRIATEAVFEALPTWLESGLSAHEPLYRSELDRYRGDLALLEGLTSVPLVHFDLCVWESPRPVQALPGRHALFGQSDCDRVLWLSPAEGGTLARFLISTLSWFELPGRKALPRPDLEALAKALNRLEGTDPEAPQAWRFQNTQTASPEVWFGRAKMPLFLSDASPYMAPSRLEGATIKSEVMEALRSVWALENEDDTANTDDIFAV